MPVNTINNNTAKGFTLIELIIGIVVLSISFSIITNLILPLSEKSAEQIHQIRASELGQSMMNEILARAFDENSDMAGGLVRCGEPDATINPCSTTLGADTGETESVFYDDVDDYINFNFATETNTQGEQYSELYIGFNVQIEVCYSDFDGDCSDDDDVKIAKLITITVTTPQDFDFAFAVYKANF